MKNNIYKNGVIRYSSDLAWPIRPKINISIVFTYKCSLNCPYCNQTGEKKQKTILNLKLFQKILDKIFESFSDKLLTYDFAFNLLGGELSELSLEYNKKALSIIIEKINKYNLKTEITWLSNYTADNNYYLDLFEYVSNNLDLNKNIFEFLFSIHSIYIKNNSNQFIQNKLIKLFESNKTIQENTCIKIFGKNLANKYIQILKNYEFSPSFEIGDLNFLSYKKQFEKNKNNLRTVKCYNYNYDITPTGDIINQCGTKMNLFNFSTEGKNGFKKCGIKCPIGDFEFNVYKELV